MDNLSGSNLDLEASLDLATTDATLNVSAPITTAAWHYVAMSWTDDDDDEITIWVNGINRGSSTNGSGAPAADHNNLFIGGTTTNNFDGRIDDFKVYNSELTAAQIKGDFTARSAAAFGGVLGAQDNEGFGGNPPVGWWNFDENTGTTVYDISGNGNLLSFNGTADWVPGKIGSALDFDTNDFVVNTNISSDLIITGDLSISAWIYRNTTTTDDGIIEESGDGGAVSGGEENYVLYINDTDNVIRFTWEWWDGTLNTESTESSVGLNNPSGSWVHIVATRDTTANEVAFYENGQQLGTVVSYTNDPTGGDDTPDLEIGEGQGSNDFDGKIDQVRVYNYELSPAQIAYDFNRGAPLGYWQFDECSGTTANDAGSGGNNGTINVGDTSGSNDSVGTCSSGAGDEMWDNGTTGKRNASLDFDGTNDYTRVSAVSTLQITGDVSFGAWFKSDTIGDNEAVIYVGGGAGETEADNELYMLRWDTTSGNDLQYKHENDAGSNTSITFDVNLSTGTWYHGMIVRDVSTNEVKLYVNGLQTGGTQTYTNDPTGGTNATLDIGSETLTDFFDGLIDDVRVYNYELTDDQVKRIFNHGAQFFGPSEGSP